MTILLCPECRKVFVPERPEQRFCNRRCARISQARGGVPSQEDKEARLADAILKAVREIFKE